MSEEEIIEIVNDFLKINEIYSTNNCPVSYLSEYQQAIKGLLDLYNKEKEKNASLRKEIKLMQSCDLVKVIKKQQKEIEELEIIADDIKGHNIVYTDTPEFEDKFISKDIIREKIKELEQIKTTALTDRTIEMMNDKISILNLILEE